MGKHGNECDDDKSGTAEKKAKKGHITGAVGECEPPIEVEGEMQNEALDKNEKLEFNKGNVPGKLSGHMRASMRGSLDDDDLVLRSPYSKILAICTNNVLLTDASEKEKGNTNTFIRFTIIKILSAGFTTSPYEPADAPKKQRVFFDEKNKPIDIKPSTTMKTDGSALLCNSYEKHPQKGLETRARGKVTDVVGRLSPGISMLWKIYDDSKSRIMENEGTEAKLLPFQMIVLQLDMRSVSNCEIGYGMVLRKISVVANGNNHAYDFWRDTLWYTDRADIREQSVKFLEAKSEGVSFESDMNFVKGHVGFDVKNEKIYEKPVVILDPNVSSLARIEKLQCNKHIRAVIEDPMSIYYDEDLFLDIHSSEFTVATSMDWLSEYYTWCLGSKSAKIIVFHDDYRRMKGKENGPMSACRAIVSVDYMAMLGVNMAPSSKLVLTPAEKCEIDTEIGRELCTEQLSGWLVHIDTVNQIRYAVLFDGSKERCALGNSPVDEDISDDEKKHFSPVCEVYENMNPKRKVWVAYFCTFKSDGSVSVLQAGIQSTLAPVSRSANMAMPRNISGQSYLDLLS